jgi:hypothetical protein
MLAPVVFSQSGQKKIDKREQLCGARLSTTVTTSERDEGKCNYTETEVRELAKYQANTGSNRHTTCTDEMAALASVTHVVDLLL